LPKKIRLTILRFKYIKKTKGEGLISNTIIFETKDGAIKVMLMLQFLLHSRGLVT